MSAIANQTYHSVSSMILASIPVLGWRENESSQIHLLNRIDQVRGKLSSSGNEQEKSTYYPQLIKLIEAKNDYKVAAIISDFILVALIANIIGNGIIVGIFMVGAFLHSSFVAKEYNCNKKIITDIELNRLNSFTIS